MAAKKVTKAEAAAEVERQEILSTVKVHRGYATFKVPERWLKKPEKPSKPKPKKPV